MTLSALSLFVQVIAGMFGVWLLVNFAIGLLMDGRGHD